MPATGLNPAQLIAVIRDAAREAAREAVAEALRRRVLRDDDYTPAAMDLDQADDEPEVELPTRPLTAVPRIEPEAPVEPVEPGGGELHNRLSLDERGRLRAALDAAGWSQGALARHLGLTSSHISGIITGSRKSARTVERVMAWVAEVEPAPAPEVVEPEPEVVEPADDEYPTSQDLENGRPPVVEKPASRTGKVPPAEVDRIVEWLAEAVEPAVGEHVFSHQLVDRYNEVREKPLHAVAAGRFLGAVLTELGYRKADRDYLDPARGRTKRVAYLDLRLRPADKADDDAEGAPPPAWLVERHPSEDKHLDKATYEGKWPGAEIPSDFRNKVIVPVLKAGKGWRYYPCNPNGRGKPRLVSPDGETFTLPNTPSDWRGLRNTAASLKRLGALPKTAASR